MSPSTTVSPPSEAPPAPHSSAPPPKTTAASDETTRRLRAEAAATSDAGRQARLLSEMAEIEERAGDAAGAARDYLAACDADPAFREPLEGLARLFDYGSGLKGLGARLFDALVESADAPDERVRALLMHANYLSVVTGDLEAALNQVRDATMVRGAPAAEKAIAWLTLEVLAGRTGDAETRAEALAERTRHATDPTWHALLLIDRGRAAAAAGDLPGALTLIEEARNIESQAVWTATRLLERLIREAPAASGDEARTRIERHAGALEALGALVQNALVDPARAEALGVPRWMRTPGRAIDAWLRAAERRRDLRQMDAAAAALNRALFLVDRTEGADARIAEAAVAQARIRLAEQTGDTALAAQLSARRLATETDGALGAGFALRVAEQAAAEGDARGALDALARAVAHDPGSLPARALQLDILADTGDAPAFASQLESFADHLATDEARARAFLLASYVWAVRAADISGAKAALSQAAMFGASPETTARVGRTLASIAADAGWYEEATKRLLATGTADDESVSLYVELIRLRWARGDVEAAGKAVRDLADAPGGRWLARVLEGFASTPASAASVVAAVPSDRDAESDPMARARLAIEDLAAAEPDVEQARALGVAAAMRAQAGGDPASARRLLGQLAERRPDDAVIAAYLGDLDRAAGDHGAAARIASAAAAAADDAELAAAMHLEAAFEHWHSGHRKRAVDEMEAAVPGSPESAHAALGWACWAVDPDGLDARRRAIREASQTAADSRALALERFATEVAAGESQAAGAELANLDTAPAGSLNLAAALGRLVAPQAAGASPEALADALSRVAARGPRALLFAGAERVRFARESGDPEATARAAHAWFEAGGALPATLEWLAAATAMGDHREEIRARTAFADCLTGDARAAMQASAALMQTRVDIDAPTPLVGGGTAAARLANLELGPPGCDPRRRAWVLEELDGVLGDDAALDAAALAGWSHLAANDLERARRAFEGVVSARPEDLGSWEGLRACGERGGNKDLQARSAAELGARSADDARGAAFWEEAALIWLATGDADNADRALEASFGRDAKRAVAFDKLFRRTRDRKDNDKLLAIISRRLEVTDEAAEIQKLFWEQARVLREMGDQDGALRALEHVTMIDPDHVGALALLGEINIRRGQFEDAAAALARLAMLDTAPPKNRVTAGVAAADLYENKLRQFNRALEVLLALHNARLSTLPVRERLAKTAARTGDWAVATATLEQLMMERPDPAGRVEAARLAMAIHRDRQSNPQGAVLAVIKLLEDAPMDGEALDLLLTTQHPPQVRAPLLENARAALLDHLQRKPMDAENVRRLAEVARARGEDGLQQAALGALATLGASDAAAEQAFAQLAARKPRVPQVAIPPSMLRAILAPGDEGRIADLFVILGPTIADALGPNLQASGVGKRDRIDPRSGVALRNEIATWAGAFGIEEFELYVGGKDPLTVQGVPGEPPALVVGAGVNAPLAPLTRARVARELLGVARGTTITRWRDDVTIASIVVAACHLADVRIEHPPYAVLAEVERLVGRAISRKTRRLLPEVCAAIASQRADGRAWSRRALASHDRIASIASGDPSVVLSDVLGVSLDRLGHAVPGNQRAEELLRFVLSQAYVDIRQTLGLEGG
jgi:cellulose synthase operon protein C